MMVVFVILHKSIRFDELFSSGVTAVVATILTISLVSTKVRSFKLKTSRFWPRYAPVLCALP
jgi:hypothetical protein